MLSELVLHGWPSPKVEVQKDLQPYQSFRGKIAVIGGIVIKGRIIIVLVTLQDRALKQLHLNHVGMEKTQLLACESMYWIRLNSDIEEMIN